MAGAEDDMGDDELDPTMSDAADPSTPEALAGKRRNVLTLDLPLDAVGVVAINISSPAGVAPLFSDFASQGAWFPQPWLVGVHAHSWGAMHGLPSSVLWVVKCRDGVGVVHLPHGHNHPAPGLFLL